MLNVPAPAMDGKKEFPLIPCPLNVPPDGVPVSVTELSFEQYVAARPVKDTPVKLLTTTLWLELAEQLLPLV